MKNIDLLGMNCHTVTENSHRKSKNNNLKFHDASIYYFK